MIEEQNAALWFSGKEMLRGKQLKDFVGKNEKTKIIAKLQKVLRAVFINASVRKSNQNKLCQHNNKTHYQGICCKSIHLF